MQDINRNTLIKVSLRGVPSSVIARNEVTKQSLSKPGDPSFALADSEQALQSDTQCHSDPGFIREKNLNGIATPPSGSRNDLFRSDCFSPIPNVLGTGIAMTTNSRMRNFIKHEIRKRMYL